MISAKKSLRISAKAFFFGDHLFLAGKTAKICDLGQKKFSDFGEDLFFFEDHLIFTETSPSSNSEIMKIWVKFAVSSFDPLILILPPHLAKLATPLGYQTLGQSHQTKLASASFFFTQPFQKYSTLNTTWVLLRTRLN